MRASGLLVILGACGRLGFEPGANATGGDAQEDLSASSTHMRITFDNAGREALLDVPVLVTFDATRLDYSTLQADARDLRFLDADGSALPYEIDVWDPAGTSRVWIRVPAIDANSTTDYVLAVYGNPNLTDGQSAAAVWSDYTAVWHFREAPGGAARALDSSPNQNDGAFQASMNASALTSGRIGTAISLDGVDDYIVVSDTNTLDLGTLTIEGWIRLARLPAAGGAKFMIVAKDGLTTDTTGAYNAFVNEVGRVSYETNNLTPTGFAYACCAAANTWAAFAVTLDQTATSRSFLNGAPGTTQTDVTPTPLNTPLTIGRRGDPDAFFAGALDEIRISSRARSAAWIAAQYASMTDTLITYGSPER